MSFYNTTGEKNPQLDAFTKKAVNQDDVVEALFAENPFQTYTPSEVWQKLIDQGKISSNTPLTSIRRSMTSLTKGENSILAKLMWKTKKGLYGRPEHYWTKANI